MNELVEAALQFIDHRARDGKVDIVNKLSAKHFVVEADELRLKQIMVNLLTNAVKFTPERGTVSVDAKMTPNGDLDITISDTGIGMDRPGIETALTTFGQIQSEITQANEGSGLGIPLTKGLVEAHGGQLFIDSEMNVGTTVTVRLPGTRVLN